MPDQTSTIISKVWGMCGPLRDDGVSYGDYLEQLKMCIRDSPFQGSASTDPSGV